MLKNTFFLLLVCMAVLLLASGCAPSCTEYDIDHNSFSYLHPATGSIVNDLTPTFEWGYPSECNPYEFRLELSENIPGTGTTYNISGAKRDFTLSSPLEAGSKYFWNIYATTVDEYHGYNPPDFIFYTGPTCSNVTPVAPVLDLPADGEFVTPKYISDSLQFHWHYPEYCLPTTFIYEFASDPNFVNILESGETPNHSQFVNKSFQDCTTVYWHVAAKNGNLMGPFSETRSFNWIWDPNCWMNHYLSDDIAEISGRVYLDRCEQTGQFVPSNFQLTAGCVITPKFGVHADGTYSQNEHGLSSVVINLGAGPCPSIGLDQDTTHPPNGGFDFIVLTPGEYCLSVSKAQTAYDYNDSAYFDLTDGFWTEPITYAPVAEYTISLGTGYHVIKQDFGWDEYNAMIKEFKQPTYCRVGPDPICDPLKIFEVGEFAPMLARNAPGTWILTNIEGMQCYFYDSEDILEDTGDDALALKENYEKRKFELEAFDPLPPCPTPVPTPKPAREVDCSKFTSQDSCLAAGCKWSPPAAAASFCYK
jgi:hypothetical protein